VLVIVHKSKSYGMNIARLVGSWHMFAMERVTVQAIDADAGREPVRRLKLARTTHIRGDAPPLSSPASDRLHRIRVALPQGDSIGITAAEDLRARPVGLPIRRPGRCHGITEPGRPSGSG
jgi:hypothetical protein